jgi:hypothetical protein
MNLSSYIQTSYSPIAQSAEERTFDFVAICLLGSYQKFLSIHLRSESSVIRFLAVSSHCEILIAKGLGLCANVVFDLVLPMEYAIDH